jgi:hypothetical protein
MSISKIIHFKEKQIPQDQGENDQPEIDKMNAGGAFLDPHPQIAFDLTACCSSDERH